MVDDLERLVICDPGPGRVMVELSPTHLSLYHEAGRTLSVELVDTAGAHHVRAIATNTMTVVGNRPR